MWIVTAKQNSERERGRERGGEIYSDRIGGCGMVVWRVSREGDMPNFFPTASSWNSLLLLQRLLIDLLIRSQRSFLFSLSFSILFAYIFFFHFIYLSFSLSLSLSWCFLFLISACSWLDGLHKINGYRIQVGMFYLLFYVCMWSLRSCWWESGSISTPFAMLSSWVSLLFLAFFSFLVSWVFFLSHPLDFWNFSLHFLFILLSGSQKVRFYIDWMFFPPWYWNGFLEDFFCDFIYLTLGMPNAFKRLLGEYMAP